MSDVADKLEIVGVGFRAGFFNKNQANDFAADNYGLMYQAAAHIRTLETQLAESQARVAAVEDQITSVALIAEFGPGERKTAHSCFDHESCWRCYKEAIDEVIQPPREGG